MKVLHLSGGVSDYATRFKVAGVRGEVSLFRDYKTHGDGIYWGMQRGIILKSSYSAEEIENTERMKHIEPIENGEVVMIEGAMFKAKVMGNYSDCVVFEPAE